MTDWAHLCPALAGQYGMGLPLLAPSSPQQAYTTQLPTSYQVGPASPGRVTDSPISSNRKVPESRCSRQEVKSVDEPIVCQSPASQMSMNVWMSGSRVFTTTLPSAYTAGAVPTSGGSVRISSPLPVQTAAWQRGSLTMTNSNRK